MKARDEGRSMSFSAREALPEEALLPARALLPAGAHMNAHARLDTAIKPPKMSAGNTAEFARH